MPLVKNTNCFPNLPFDHLFLYLVVVIHADVSSNFLNGTTHSNRDRILDKADIAGFVFQLNARSAAKAKIGSLTKQGKSSHCLGTYRMVPFLFLSAVKKLNVEKVEWFITRSKSFRSSIHGIFPKEKRASNLDMHLLRLMGVFHIPIIRWIAKFSLLDLNSSLFFVMSSGKYLDKPHNERDNQLFKGTSLKDWVPFWKPNSSLATGSLICRLPASELWPTGTSIQLWGRFR